MRLADIVSFRKDLLFNGAVQIGWFESERVQAEKAAEHFVFHGPDYHGVVEDTLDGGTHKLVDTASFTLDILEQVYGNIADEPFALAIAGYGTGKSHLGVTLASLLSAPKSDVAKKILENLKLADARIGNQVKRLMASVDQPFLVIAINGMQDFDLNNEIIRQVLLVLNRNGLDTSILENLRPRFKTAINFTESFYVPLRVDFEKDFGCECTLDGIIERLKCQDEDTFSKISKIYESKMGSPIHAVGQESLHDFIRTAKESYCGPGKPFAGILIIFDEFGRYLEFAVQKPHVAGSGALQQLYECVQANGDGVFLLCFIQYELKAYISRVAPELREDLNRYVTRYDAVRKVKLSTNLETLIANLLEKRDTEELKRQVASAAESSNSVQAAMQSWFPDLRQHAVWINKDKFRKIIYEGCWPLHPLSTWMLYKLSSVGKSLQQRSALSLLAEVYEAYQNNEWKLEGTIVPVDLCNEAMISEFLASERYGQQGAAAHAYETVLHKYRYELTADEKTILKAVLVSAKIGVKVESKEDYLRVLTMFGGLTTDAVADAIRSLESEFGVLEWNERLRQFEIAGDAVPRRAFAAHLAEKVAAIDAKTRAQVFSQNYAKWTHKEIESTDFGAVNEISSREWNYRIFYSDVTMLKGKIDYALRTWRDARGPDEERGQLVYCYVGPESNFNAIRELAAKTLRTSMEASGLDWQYGAPVCIFLLHDKDGLFGAKVAEYWVLQEQFTDEEVQKYANFINDRKNNVEQEMSNLFSELERDRYLIFATEVEIPKSRIQTMLTKLFDVVYPRRIPFPFDGFHTAKGNAAKDCQVFTRELFKGTLDRDWIAACNAQQKNRAYTVLDKSWGAINDDGSIRMKPKNEAVGKIVEFLDNKLSGPDNTMSRPVNLGSMLRLLCGPPYGCNIASAGLLLGLFIGKRKNSLNLLRNRETVSIETWLSDALKGNFLDLSVLNATDMVRVSKESLSEWEKLLEEWESETLLLGKVASERKAEELQKRVPVPQALYYKYNHLLEKAQKAKQRLKTHNNIISDALQKVELGAERQNFNSLSWGAAELANLYEQMQLENDEWTDEQIAEVERRLASARIKVKELFPIWLPRQGVRRIEDLGQFKHIMLTRIGGNLAQLKFMEEKQKVEDHVEEVEKNVRTITALKATTNDIETFVLNNKVNDSTPVSVINAWLEQIREFVERLEEAEQRTTIVAADVRTAKQKLAEFQETCKKQLERHKQRAEGVFSLERISSYGELANLRAEVASLLGVYEGLEKDVEDLRLVQRQLDLVERHFGRLDDGSLDEEEFEVAFEECIKETEQAFPDDAPPLDNELIYGCIKEVLKSKREAAAAEWMDRTIPEPKMIIGFDASTAIAYITRLQKAPPVLSTVQLNIVREAIAGCERRLNELEVEGLLAKFESMSEENKRSFVKRIFEYIKSFLNGESKKS